MNHRPPPYMRCARFQELSMVVVAAILGLAIVLAALNWFEFGRID
ncbi:hypothetical protein [Brevundimonas sp.]|nr:hypothetical protein [Brevundimonas sp.]